ncbi:MAG TPA: aminopeptidase, partial [Pseudomonas sp.]|nr:aminopeptidase [Pseudomonas sp.]
DNTTYTRYTALPGPYPLWNLFVTDPQTDPQLAERLRTASQIRRYAVEALALPDNTTYTR